MIAERIRGGLTLAATEKALGRSPWRAAAPAPGRRPTVPIVAGYITAFLLPLVGLIIGVVLARRDGSVRRHGRWIAAIAIALLLIGVALRVSAPEHPAASGPRPSLITPGPSASGLTPGEEAMLREAMSQQGR